MPERNTKDKETHSPSANGALIPSEDVWGLWAFISVDVLTNSRSTLNIRAARTRVGVGHQRSLPESHAITVTILNIKGNLNISAHTSRHMLFINKSQTWARRWVHNLGGGRVMQCFWGVLKHVAHMCASTRKSCWSAVAASVPLYAAAASQPAGFGSDIQKNCRKELVFSVFSISYGIKQKLLALPSRRENHEATIQ